LTPATARNDDICVENEGNIVSTSEMQFEFGETKKKKKEEEEVDALLL